MSRNKQNKPAAVTDEGPSAEQIQAALEQAASQGESDVAVEDQTPPVDQQEPAGQSEQDEPASEQFERGQTPAVQHLDEAADAQVQLPEPAVEHTEEPVQEPEPSVDPEVHPAFANKWEALCTAESLPLYRQLSDRYKLIANRALYFIEVMQLNSKKILVTHDKGIEMTIDFYRSLVRGINRAGNERRVYLEFICACIRPYRGDDEIFGIKQAHAWFDFLVTIPRVEVESWSKLIELLRVGCDPRGRKIATRGMDLVSYVQGFTGPGLIDGDSAQFIVHFMTE